MALYFMGLIFFVMAVLQCYFLKVISGLPRNAVKSMDDAILIIDHNNRIAGFNPALTGLFEKSSSIRTRQPITTFIQILRDHCEINSETTTLLTALESKPPNLFEGEIRLRHLEQKYFQVKIRLIMNKKKFGAGSLLSMM